MKKFNGKILFSTIGTIIAVALMAIAIFFATEKSYFVEKNNENIFAESSRIATADGSFQLNSDDIIRRASQLLGKDYEWGLKGYNAGTLWTRGSYNSNKLLAANQIGSTPKTTYNKGIDCSGLIFWTLAGLNVKTSGFNFQNPVPVDTNHWVSFTNPKVSVNGGSFKSINILKNNEAITSSNRYYNYNGDKVLPAGTIVVSFKQGVTNHAWITLGDLGTTDVNVVKQILNDMGITNIPNGSVVKKSDTCTYWRIEAIVGSGVIIDNADPNAGSTENGKKIGNIYAFQIANSVINGNYSISIEKDDSKGNPLNLTNQEMASIFETKLNGTVLNGSVKPGALIQYRNIDINSSNYNTDDTIVIKEINTPAGRQKVFDNIEIVVQKAKEGNKYVASISSVKVDGTALQKTEANGVATFANDKIIVTSNNGRIAVKIKNPTIDLALKKMIQKINGEEVRGNAFNTDRITDTITGCKVTQTPLNQGETNAIYTLNKTPVEIKIGDKVEYQIRIYNEGEVKAYAGKITDYIPNGLTVENVYYKDRETVVYNYDSNNRVLSITVPDESFIDEFNGQVVKYDYVTVVCNVDNNATGVLTNVAEISEYRNANNEIIAKDIDSTANNWKAANNEDKLTNTKDSDAWKNYSNDQDNKLGNWNPFVSQKSEDANGDDDDFDKLIVLKDYEFVLEKRDSDGLVSTIPFTIKRETQTIKNNETLENGSFSYTEKVSTNETVERRYIIKEETTAGYIQLRNPLTLDVKIINGILDSYKINEENKYNNQFTNDSTKDYQFTSTLAGQYLSTRVIFDKTNSRITIQIENKKETSDEYSIKLKKVSQESNTALTGVTFSATQTKAYLFDATEYEDITPTAITGIAATGADGITTLVENVPVTKESTQYFDKYVVNEVNLGTNTTYSKLNTPVAIYVGKAYDATTEKFVVVDWYVAAADADLYATTNRIVNGNGKLTITEGPLTFDITAEKVNNVITVTVPNIPDETIRLEITKLDKDDPTKALEGTWFKIIAGGNNSQRVSRTDNSGKATIAEGIPASTQEYNFRIEEITPANGYDNILKGKYIDIQAGLTSGTVDRIISSKLYDVSTNEEITDPELTGYYSVSVDGGIIKLTVYNKETPHNVDLALKKVIVEVDGKAVNQANGFDAKQDRVSGQNIDTTPLDAGFIKGQKHDAKYYLNKTPVLVQRGSIVKYQLRIYNESNEVAATASEIKDYLPEGLIFVAAYDKNGTQLTQAQYTYSEANKELVVRALTTPIPAYVLNSGNISYDYITVECKVENDAKGILTNISEISEYHLEDGTTIPSDFDSTSNNWDNPDIPRRSDNWIHYKGDESNRIQDGVFKEYPGQEDDDDFEKVIVGEIDLVLKKIITRIGDKDQSEFEERYRRFQDGKVIVHTEKMDNYSDVTTSEYELNKTIIPVKVGDIVTYQIRIYNEGEIDATAKTITDYIPKGMTFNKVYYRGAELVAGRDYQIRNNVLSVNAMNDLITKYTPGNEPQYDYITVECTVNGDVRGTLTNVAEITNYVTFFGVTDVDRDSETTEDGQWHAEGNSNKLTLDGKSGSDWANYYASFITTGFNDYPGQQDDDDFEKVQVIDDIIVKIRKVSAMNSSKGLEGATFAIQDISSNAEPTEPVTYTTNAEGYTNQIERNLDGYITYKITEVNTRDGYAKLKNPIAIRIAGQQVSPTAGTVLIGYFVNTNCNAEEENWEYVSRIGEKYFSVEDENGRSSIVRINWTKENGISTFEIIIDNSIIDAEHDVYLQKVNSKGENISGVKFSVINRSQRDAQPVEIITEDGLKLISSIGINVTNFNKEELYSIQEIETPENYIKLPEELMLAISNGLSENEDKYEVKTLRLYYGDKEAEDTNKAVISDILVGPDGQTIDITAELKDVTLEDNTVRKAIVLTIPNEAEKNYYGIRMIKVNSEGDNEGLANATFTIKEDKENAEAITSTVSDRTGIASLLEEVKIDSVQPTTYIINESEVPENYIGLAEPIKVKINKTNVELGTELESVEVSIEGVNSITVARGGEATIENVKLTDGTSVTLLVSVSDENIISITVPNKPQYFDLSLRKFINKINGEEISQSREPVIDAESIRVLEEEGTALYHHPKNSLIVNLGDEIEYTLRVYNEGEILGFAKEITDYLPQGLSFVKLSNDNSAEYTTETEAGSRVVVIKYNGNKEIKSLKDFVGKEINVTNEYYQEVKLICKVEESNVRFITNRAEITNYGYTYQPEVGYEEYETKWKEADTEGVDIDSVEKTIENELNLDTWYENAEAYTRENVEVEDYYPGVQDDDDFETVEIAKKEFDLSLRKFITAINDYKLQGEESREPVVDVSKLITRKETTATYTHPKTPVLVNAKDIVNYTLRIYNEGEIDGYATQIIDDVPAGVTMVAPEYDEQGKPANINAEYRWVMFKEISDEEIKSNKLTDKIILRYADKYYVETENAEEAVLISTDYLSKANGETMMNAEVTENPNLIKAFDGKALDYKDIKVQFKVKNGNDPSKIITNYAQISEDEDGDGNEVEDRDSTTNEWIDGEDDQDIENLRVTWFDLALYKWVSSTIVTEDGKTKEYASGHTQEDKSKIVNVTVAKEKLDKTVVKFKWQIKVENQGIIAGYAKELKDHVPAGLKFVEADNTEFGWKLAEDGTIITDYLKDTLLQPGETAEVTVILTWINNENNLGVKVNSAEISKDYNEYGEKDIDSTPDNFKGKPEEDDEDQDEVRLNIRTGNGIKMEYIIVALGVVAIMAAGIVLIKKNVLEK